MCAKCISESTTTFVQLVSYYCSGRTDTGGHLSEVPSLPSTGATSSDSAQDGTDGADEPEEPEHLNVDDFFVMKASSECMFIIKVVIMIRFL